MKKSTSSINHAVTSLLLPRCVSAVCIAGCNDDIVSRSRTPQHLTWRGQGCRKEICVGMLHTVLTQKVPAFARRGLTCTARERL